MNRIIYLLVLLLCFAGCKKEEVNESIKFAKLTFQNETKFSLRPSIKYNGKTYDMGYDVPIAYGDKKVEAFKWSGEKILDTVITVNGPVHYYIYQPDSTVAPILVTTLPEPPGEPGNPLNGEPAAAEGYIKIKVAFQTQFIMQHQKVNVLIMNGDEVVATLPGVDYDYNTDFFLVKRPILYDGTLGTVFALRFIDPATGELIMNSDGGTYTTDAPTILPLGNKNIYMFYINDYEEPGRRNYGTSILAADGKYYGFAPTILWARQ